MKPKRLSPLPILSSAVVILSLSLSGCSAGTQDHKRDDASQQDCMVIDTDWDIDDLMAVPAIVANENVAAIVTTEGYSRAPQSAGAIAALLANSSQKPSTSVIVGASQKEGYDPEVYPWIPEIRESLEKLNGLLLDPIIPAPNVFDYSASVASAVQDCESVDVVVLGPLTSFVHYSGDLQQKINRVIMQGKPLGDSSQKPGVVSFNCRFDMDSCEKARTQLNNYNAIWVDVPRDTDPPYSPSGSMVEGLDNTGLPGTLKAALNANPALWRTEDITNGNVILLWDQSAALFVTHPEVFARVGGHWETTLSPSEFRTQWTSDINNANRHVGSHHYASLGSRDVYVCIVNESSQKIFVEWSSTTGVSSHEPSGAVDKLSQSCAEGPLVNADISFMDEFVTVLEAQNPVIGYPSVGFYSAEHFTHNVGGEIVITGNEYASASFSVGETVNSDVEGHQFSVTRTANNAWVNFTVTVKE